MYSIFIARLISWFWIYCEPAEFFERSEKKRSVGGADKSCESVKKNFTYGLLFSEMISFCGQVFVSRPKYTKNINFHIILIKYFFFLKVEEAPPFFNVEDVLAGRNHVQNHISELNHQKELLFMNDQVEGKEEEVVSVHEVDVSLTSDWKEVNTDLLGKL